MESNGCRSDMYPIRESRGNIELWKAHARQKHDMSLAGLIRWLINLDISDALQHDIGNGGQVQNEEFVLLKERLKEMEREIELRDNEINSMHISGNVRAIITLALNMEKEVRRLFSDQPLLRVDIDVISRALSIPESSDTERRALEFVLHHLLGVEFLCFKGGKYFVNG